MGAGQALTIVYILTLLTNPLPIMKSVKLSPFFSTVFAIALLTFASSASAQLIAYDDAGEYLVTANWTNGANQGFGFTPWAIETNGPDFHGTYITTVNSPAFVIDSVTNVLGTNYTDVFALFANGPTDRNQTTAYRGFANSLGTNTFKIQWGSRGAGSTSTTNSGTVHGWCGFSLRNGNATNLVYDINSPDSTALLYIYFLDGASPSTLYLWDGNGVQSIGGTSFSNLGRNNITNAIEAEVTPGADGLSYHLILKDCVLNQTLFTTNSIFMSASTVDSVALFADETTGDQVYNRLQITVPNIPPTISNLQPANGSLYLNAATTSLSFEVDSFNSTVSSNLVSVYLNGVAQSNLTFNVAGPTTALQVSCATVPAADTFYNFTIIAQDASGNVSSNNYTFNTFLPGDLYIDAYDYNYNMGQFINSSMPSNSYAGLLGTNFVDYQIADLTGVNNTAGYRPGDLVEILSLNTDATGDPIDHANLRANGFTAYNIGFTDTGNWENYTRVMPVATNYSIYARAASGTGGQFEIEMLAGPTATTTNQPLAALGRVNVPITGGSLVYSGQLQPLVDFFGNTVVLPLSGTNTLRETAITSKGYNLEYLVVVAVTGATNTLRPYIATGSPVPSATGANLTTPVSFTLVNRQTSVPTNTIKLLVNNTNQTKLVLSSNLAGVTVTWTPTNNLPANYTNLVTVIFTDSSGTNVTNSWNFVTGTSGGVIGSGLWTGGGGSNDMYWADGINWTNGTPGSGSSANFASLGATTSLVTNNIVATNVTILQLNYETNNSGFHTTWIQDGVTLTITNGNTATGVQAIQVGGAGNGADNSFNSPVTNTITGMNGTLLVLGNAQSNGFNNSLNIQVRQNTTGPCPPNFVTLDMSGLGTMVAVVGKFYVAQGGSGNNQTNMSGCLLLARTNVITCLRGNAGQFEVGDSSGGGFESPGSTLNLGITNALFVDTMRFGKQKATNNLVRFNPAFTNITTPAAFIRGTNGLTSRVTIMTIGDCDTETTVPNYAQATVDFSGGKVDALLTGLTLGRGETSASDSGYAQGTLTLTAGTLNVINVTNGLQRANNTATESGIINLNGTATLISTNIILAQATAGATASLVSGSLNVTNGSVLGNIIAGGGVSTVNLNGGSLVVSNFAGTTVAPLSALNLTSASLHLKADGNATTTNIVATAVTATGTSTITIDSIVNVTGPKTIHLLGYNGTDPFGSLALAPLPSGFSGNLVDNPGSIDLSLHVAPIVPPTIRGITISSSQVIISGTNNVGAGGTYHILTTTNLTLAITNWTVLTNGSFDANGNFSSTNAVGTNSQSYFKLQVP